MPNLPHQQTQPSSPLSVFDENVEFSRIIDEAELRQIKLSNERSEAVMNGIVPSWYSAPINKESNSPKLINEPLKETAILPLSENPER